MSNTPRVRARTNGMSLPGFHSGWYRLRSGGHDLARQPGAPQALPERLRAMATGAASR